MCERETVERDVNSKIAERNALLAGNDVQSNTLNSAHEFFGSFLKYQSGIEPTSEMVNELVEAVYINDADRIEVRFSFRDELEQVIKTLEGKI